MHPALGVLASSTLQGNVGATATAQLLERADDSGLVGDSKAQLLEVNKVQLVLVLSRPLALNQLKPLPLIDKDDLGRALQLRG